MLILVLTTVADTYLFTANGKQGRHLDSYCIGLTAGKDQYRHWYGSPRRENEYKGNLLQFTPQAELRLLNCLPRVKL